MLKAILHGKAGRVEANKGESVSWSSLFKAREDLLTSTVFERFAYLSDAVQIDFIKYCFKAAYGIAPVNFGSFESITYWPRYTHEHEDGINQVEPDLVLNFEECNIIVEVKPPDGGDQYQWQWQKEIESFLQSDNKDEKPLYFLAIGRIEDVNAKQWSKHLLQVNQFGRLKGIAALKWSVVTEYIIYVLSTNDRIPKQENRILNDILEGLSLYGLQNITL